MGKTVTTNGCFDILHIGHVDFLKRCRAMGDRLIVGLNSDASVKRIKGPQRPINPHEWRRDVLLALRCVDDVVVFDEDDPCEFIRRAKPDIHVKGAEYKDKDIPERRVCDEMGIELAFLEHRYDVSTTGILRRQCEFCSEG